MLTVRVVIAAALVAAAVVFAIGVGIERSQGDHHDTPASTEQGTGKPAPAGAEGSEAREQQERDLSRTSNVSDQDVHSGTEKLFGVNTEANWVVAVAFAVALGLAAAVLVSPTTAVLVLVALIAAAVGVFDIREAMHQADESRTNVLALAVVAATLHFGVAVLAIAAATPILRRRSA